MPKALATLLETLPDGVAHAALPTPFAVGPVNCWLLPEAPITVIDPGMATQESLVALRGFIGAAGLRLDEVDQVLITHAHPDHFGAAGWLSDAADAPVLIGRAEIPKLHAYSGRDVARFSPMLGVLDDFGVPPEVRAVLPEFRKLIDGFVSPLDDDRLRPVDDGDSVRAGGRDWTAHVTPGHAAGHLSLYDGQGTLFSGDHLLPRISPNPFLEFDDADPPQRRLSLIEYLASLDRFTALDPDWVLPGHGEAFTDLPAWADRVRVHHTQRSEEILGHLHAAPGSTVHDLTGRLFPDLDGFSLMLGFSEIAGHLDVLARDGSAVSDGTAPTRWYPTPR